VSLALARAASARHLLRHPAQLVLAIVGLALGVATIVAIDIAVESSRRAFGLSLDAVNGTSTHRLVAGPEGLDQQLYVKLRLEGLVPAVPVIEGYVRVRDRTMQLLGLDPLTVRDARTELGAGARDGGESELARLTQWFTEPGTVLLSGRTARELGISIGDTFEIEIAGQMHRASLLGHLDESRATGEEGGYDTLLITDIANAQEWLGLAGRLSRIDLRVSADEAGRAALERLKASLPVGVLIEEAARANQQSLDLSAAFTTNLRAMSLLALLVGALLVYSAISFAVVQRRRTLATLRALGMTRRQVLSSVLVEAAVLGLAGALIGIVLGASIGRELIVLVSRTINDLYFVVSVREAVLAPVSIVKALAAGVGVALLAALLPAFEVARSAPQLGLRSSVLEHRAHRASVALAFGGAALAGLSVAIVFASGRSLFAGFVALFLLLAASAAMIPAVLRALALGGARLMRAGSPLGRLALASVAASLSRTGVAVAALGVALAAMIGVAVMVESFRESLREWLGNTLRADIYITAPGPGFGRPERRLEPDVVETVLRTEGIVAYSASRRVSVPSAHGELSMDALELAPAGRAGIQILASTTQDIWSAFAKGALIVSDSLAWRLQLEPGERLELVTPQGVRAFPVAGVYREYGNDRGNALIHRAVYRRIWQDDAVTSLGLYVAPRMTATAVIERLRSSVEGAQRLYMRSNAELRALSMRIFERTFVITRVLYWLSAAVAAIGLLSALLAWQLERARELALLRSLGATPGSTAALIETQTVFMGLTALLAAIPLGLATALMLIHVINRRAFGWQIDLHLRAAPFLDALTIAVAAALIAGLYPAWRAASASLASALREE
jgi:putative ABC transport system permease protein